MCHERPENPAEVYRGSQSSSTGTIVVALIYFSYPITTATTGCPTGCDCPRCRCDWNSTATYDAGQWNPTWNTFYGWVTYNDPPKEPADDESETPPEAILVERVPSIGAPCAGGPAIPLGYDARAPPVNVGQGGPGCECLRQRSQQ